MTPKSSAAVFPLPSSRRFWPPLREVDGIADAHQATIAQIMLAWYMKNPDIAVVIPGARLPEQAASNADALKVQLRDPEYGSINELFKEFRPK